MQLTIDEKRILVRALERNLPVYEKEVEVLKKLTDGLQYEIDTEQAALMFPKQSLYALPRSNHNRISGATA